MKRKFYDGQLVRVIGADWTFSIGCGGPCYGGWSFRLCEFGHKMQWKQMLKRKNKPMARHADETISRREAYEGRSIEGFELAVSDAYKMLAMGQQRLGAEFDAVLEDNMWSLYER